MSAHPLSVPTPRSHLPALLLVAALAAGGLSAGALVLRDGGGAQVTPPQAPAVSVPAYDAGQAYVDSLIAAHHRYLDSLNAE
jgi:hypothetical protein